MTSVNTLLSPFLTPLITYLMLKTTVEMNVWTMFLGMFSVGSDLYEIAKSLYERNWSAFVYNCVMLGVDIAFMVFDYNGIKESLDFNRTTNQNALIDITKEVMLKGGITEETKDILYSWAKEYDSFEDVWNIIYHIFN